MEDNKENNIQEKIIKSNFLRNRKNIVIIILIILLLINIYANFDLSKNKINNTNTSNVYNNVINEKDKIIEEKEKQIKDLQNANKLLQEQKQKIEEEKKSIEEEKQNLIYQIEELKKTSSPITQNQSISNKTITNNKTVTNKTDTSSTSTKNTNSKSSTTIKNTNSTIVYVTKTGKKYHKGGCSYLKNSKIEITLSEAQSKGYTPCSKCY